MHDFNITGDEPPWLLFEPETDFRLPVNFKPYHYNLRMRTAFDVPQPFPFSGTVKIFMTCMNVSDNVTTHSQGHNITSDPVFESLDSSAGPNYVSYKFDERHQFLIVQLDRQASVGANYTLVLNFSGFLNKGMVGFFNGSYSVENKTRQDFRKLSFIIINKH